MNKRGDTPTILLFVFAIILSTTALIVFVSFPESFESESREVNKMLNEIRFNERYVEAEALMIAREAIRGGRGDVKLAFRNIAEEKYLGYGGAGNFFGKIRNDEFDFEKATGVYVLKVKGLFVSAEKGENSIRRNFEMEIKLNENGEKVE